MRPLVLLSLLLAARVALADATVPAPGVSAADSDGDGIPDALSILEKVTFPSGDARLRAASYPILDNVADVLLQNRDIWKLAIAD